VNKMVIVGASGLIITSSITFPLPN